MSITLQLQAAARGVYRRLFRAANFTFHGDDAVLNVAFLNKVRAEYRDGRSISDAQVYAEKIKIGNEVAQFLRQNVVQGQKTKDVWRLNITPQTELGSNDTIRRSVPKDARGTDTMKPPPSFNRINFSELKRMRKGRELPVMDENDLKESFVRGSGPGGQSINKTENCVQLLHVPTGIRVSCQETRSLELNRRIARKLLLEKLDQRQNPGLSKGDFQRARMKERERQKKKKRRKKEKENLKQFFQEHSDEK
ncbi:hypothetical protein Clacol_006243 [Clathrus columnatus]|uniref:Prokaryotic-type class I peptide chain release factors domain-containing protein n=1 Tax=Clathrus columnatus TaxID=1419009 RepID=A0AAV5AGH8_9AGAM|nr:hypothetical protein Clacol_006243 [Clathrus columnatus]